MLSNHAWTNQPNNQTTWIKLPVQTWIPFFLIGQDRLRNCCAARLSLGPFEVSGANGYYEAILFLVCFWYGIDGKEEKLDRTGWFDWSNHGPEPNPVQVAYRAGNAIELRVNRSAQIKSLTQWIGPRVWAWIPFLSYWTKWALELSCLLFYHLVVWDCLSQGANGQYKTILFLVCFRCGIDGRGECEIIHKA